MIVNKIKSREAWQSHGIKSHVDSIDLFRCFLMFLIVLHHAAVHGVWSDDSSQLLLPILFTVAIFWHVDGFIAITGWFGTHFSLRRLAKIWGVLFFYTIANSVYYYITTRHFSIAIVQNWFAPNYLMFLFCVPILNAAIEKLKDDRRLLYTIWAIVDSGVFLNWIPNHMATFVWGGGFGPYSAGLFVIIYLNVRFLKVSGLAERLKLSHIIVWGGG